MEYGERELSEAEQEAFRGALISLAADSPEVQEIVDSVKQFEGGVSDPNPSGINLADNEKFRDLYGLSYIERIKAIQLGEYRREEQEEQQGV